jgi:uncharacterized protein (DUF433 family)
MSNLVKHLYNNLPSNISSKSRNVYLAHKNDMIKNIGDFNIVVNSIHQSINRSIADKGVNMLLEDLDYLKRSVTEDILKDFPTLTLQDVQLCFSMGVRGNLGEYFGMNVVTFYNWLKTYKEEIIPECVSEVVKNLPPAKIEQEEIIDYKKLDFDKIDNLCEVIIAHRENGIYNFNDFGNIHYKFLHKFSFFDDLTEDDINQLKEDAKNQVVREAKENNLSLLAQRKNYQLADINKLLDDIEMGAKDTESVINIVYLKLILKRFVMKFNALGKDIEEFKNDLITKVEKSYGE